MAAVRAGPAARHTTSATGEVADTLKHLIRPTLGFQSIKTARATIKGFEVMRMFKKGQFSLWIEAVGGGSEVSSQAKRRRRSRDPCHGPASKDRCRERRRSRGSTTSGV
jgi:hypothetical protein